jgi:hypothetical protein
MNLNRNLSSFNLSSIRHLSLRLFVSYLFVFSQLVNAQKKDENIGTEVVNVVKPYTPTISDAFKVKETPSLNDDETAKKEEIKYSIFSFPVASTFAPAKGKAAGVEKTAQEKIYNNYATIGLGNYLTALAELYVTQNVSDTDYFGGMLKHLSSQGGIKDLQLSDKYYNTSIDLTYGSKQADYSWAADAGFANKNNFWYGLPSDFATIDTPENVAKIKDKINKPQSYNDLYLGGRMSFTKSIFNDVNVKYNRFFDGFKSGENRVVIQPSFEFDAGGTTIKTKAIVDYLGGSFDKDFLNLNSIKYGFTNLGVSPTITMQKRDWSFNLGASIFYGIDIENKKNKLFVYPNINASLALVGDLMIFYAGAEGGLTQNSYRDFATENPFVSPTLGIAPNDKQFDIFGGLKGRLSNAVSYNVRASVQSEKNKALYKSNNFDLTQSNPEDYQYGNSFEVVYDDLKTVGFFGEIKAEFPKNLSLGINGNFNSFTKKFQEEAWNLPAIKLGVTVDLAITQKWYAGANIFFVGDRKDQISNTKFVVDPANIIPQPLFSQTTITLKSYFDANANLNYNYNDRITAFLRLNNIGNQGYQKWLNFPVQSFQFMLGASYKFDF